MSASGKPGASDKGGGTGTERRRRFGPEFIPLNISAPFIRRPVATTLLTIAIALAGMVAFGLLPVAPLPEVDFPVVVVRARMPGASPETMAATVARPETCRGPSTRPAPPCRPCRPTHPTARSIPRARRS